MEEEAGHLMVGKKQRVRKGPGIRYNFESHNPT
jgi:hypothetical protein